MDREQEAKMKAYQTQCAEKASENPNCDTVGTMNGAPIGYAGESCTRASLRERVASQTHRARKESRRLDRLNELEYLLDKNPEIARILDLLEEVNS